MILGIFDSLFGSSPSNSGDSRIVGCWHMVRSENSEFEPAEADFRPDGRLFYSIQSGDRWQIMKLTYEFDGQVLTTDQPSAPQKNETVVTFEEDGTLVLEFGGQKSWFQKGPKKAPEV